MYVKLSSLRPSSVFLLIRFKRFFLPDCRPTHASSTARRQLNNQTLHQTYSALPEWQSRGERRWEKQSDGASDAGKVVERGEGAGRVFSAAGSSRVGRGEKGGVSSLQLAIKNLFRGEMLHTICLAKREQRKEGILFFHFILVLRQRRGEII